MGLGKRLFDIDLRGAENLNGYGAFIKRYIFA